MSMFLKIENNIVRKLLIFESCIMFDYFYIKKIHNTRILLIVLKYLVDF